MFKLSTVLAAAALAATLGLANTSEAAVVTYTLAIGDNNGAGGSGSPGNWTLYADVSAGDNAGLVAYGVALLNTVLITNDGPRTNYDDSSATKPTPLTVGFTALRSAANTSPINGSQDTVTAQGAWLVLGFGQTGGNLLTLPPGYDSTFAPNVQTTYGAHLKVAHGTYNVSGPLPDFDGSQSGVVATKANVYAQGQLPGVVPAQTLAATIVKTVIGGVTPPPITPEPASLGVLALGGLALLARRRKA